MEIKLRDVAVLEINDDNESMGLLGD